MGSRRSLRRPLHATTTALQPATACGRPCPHLRACVCLTWKKNPPLYALCVPIILLLSTSTYLLLHHDAMRQPFPVSSDLRPQRNISVLLWHWPFGRSYELDGDKCREVYNISRCLLSDDRSTYAAADVVVFHHHELACGRSSLPSHLPRPASQRWVWLSLEPPGNTATLAPYNHLFNWTMTYRRDADVPVPYGKTVPGGGALRGVHPQNRSCLVSWVVSRYKPTQARASVYQSLKRHIAIEGHGRWFKKPISKRKLLPTIGRCLFYLAFENDEATDYISEKLWKNSFQAGVVPVVLGPSRDTYEELAPPHSFIHVKDFSNTAELAAHLKSLASNRSAYEEYFRWRRTHSIKVYSDWRERLCQICVNYSRLQANKVYHDLERWVKK